MFFEKKIISERVSRGILKMLAYDVSYDSDLGLTLVPIKS